MIIGENLWHSGITKGMSSQNIGDCQYMTYENMPVNAYEMLVKTTCQYPTHIAFVDDNHQAYMYIEFLEMVNQYAHYLQTKQGIKKGSHVGLLLYTTIDFCMNFYALSKLGAIIVPLPTKYREVEILSLIDKADLDLLVLEEKFKDWVRDYHFPQIITKRDGKYGLSYLNLHVYQSDDYTSKGHLEDDAVIMFTSGTTSAAKGVVMTNLNINHAIISYARVLGVTHEDKTVIPVPIYHITGLVALMGLFVYIGATTYLHARYDAKRILNCIRDEEITFLHGSPTVFSKMLEHSAEYPDLKSLRIMGCGSSYTPLEKMQQFHQWLPHTKFQVIYGMTETTSPALICPYDSPTSIHATAAGLPIPGLSVKILNEQGEECQPGEVGVMWLKGANVLKTYYQMTSPDIERGWLNTGDMAYVNHDNYIFVVDRQKDMINRGGEKIWSKDVEEAICMHPAVDECAVVGIEDEEYGEVAAAIVVLKAGQSLTEKELQDDLMERMAFFKVPQKILFQKEIYKTRGLKVDKKRMRELFKSMH